MEISANFDLANVEAFLLRLSSRLGIMSVDEARSIASGIGLIPVEEERGWNIDARYNGQSVLLELRAAMDDFSAPDLYFYADSELAVALARELKAFNEELGI
jgi:hypothetical protein